MKKFLLASAALTLTLGFTAAANANVEVLNFAGLNGNAEEQVLTYYDGGFGGLGSGPGPNYGIDFGTDALSCSGAPGGACNTAEIPGGPGANALFFLGGPGDVMNVNGGFTTGFSFFYSAVNAPGVVTVWSGLNDTGILLATLVLPITGADGNGGCLGEPFCPYVAAGVTFAGTAMSVDFSGTANQIGFADVTLGSSVAGVPEPGTVALLGGALAGLAGFAGLRRRKTVKA